MQSYELPLPGSLKTVLGELRPLGHKPSNAYDAVGRAWNNLLLWLGRQGVAEGLSAEALLDRGKQLKALFLDLRAALNEDYRKHRWSDADEYEDSGIIFEDLSAGYFETKRLKRCPIDLEALHEVAQAYLRLPALSNPTFDWLIVNGYLRYYAEEYWELLMSGRAFGRIHWSFLLSGGRPEVVLATRLARTLLYWLALPTLAVYFLSSNRPVWAITFAALFGLLLAVRLVTIGSTRRRAKQRRRKFAVINDIVDIKFAAGGSLWNPKDLLARVRRFEIDHPGVYLAPISSVLSRAVRRDPDVLEFWLANDDYVSPLPEHSEQGA